VAAARQIRADVKDAVILQHGIGRSQGDRENVCLARR
jgi:hypothetical protein